MSAEPLDRAVRDLREMTACRCRPDWTERRLHEVHCQEEYREDVDLLAAEVESLRAQVGTEVRLLAALLDNAEARGRAHALRAAAEDDDLWKVAADEWVRQRTELAAERDTLAVLLGEAEAQCERMQAVLDALIAERDNALAEVERLQTELADATRQRTDLSAVLGYELGIQDGQAERDTLAARLASVEKSLEDAVAHLADEEALRHEATVEARRQQYIEWFGDPDTRQPGVPDSREALQGEVERLVRAKIAAEIQADVHRSWPTCSGPCESEDGCHCESEEIAEWAAKIAEGTTP